MTKFRQRRAVFAVLVTLLGLSQVFGQDANGQPHTTAKQISHVSKTLLVPAQNGSVQKLAVAIDDWSIAEDNTEFDLPAGVSAIMSVVNGRVSIVVGGVSKEYSTSNYWTAEAGTHMSISVQVPARSAVLRTIMAAPAN